MHMHFLQVYTAGLILTINLVNSVDKPHLEVHSVRPRLSDAEFLSAC